LLDPERLQGAAKHRSGIVYGARHLLATVAELGPELSACGVDALASTFLGRDAFPIDAAYFDKQSAANWTVPIHQDRVFPVAPDVVRKHRTMNGIAVSEPSAAALAGLLAVRIHFDPTDGETGALFVLPGSHRGGLLTPEQIRAIPLSSFEPCPADVGDAIVMRPLLLHRSPPSKGAGRRRVLHVVYATEQPDSDLRWRAHAQF
jgi:ectoine hydroxylase-related dioxygenase (phytanoyl-CoA dioxygenase family)